MIHNLVRHAWRDPFLLCKGKTLDLTLVLNTFIIKLMEQVKKLTETIKKLGYFKIFFLSFSIIILPLFVLVIALNLVGKRQILNKKAAGYIPTVYQKETILQLDGATGRAKLNNAKQIPPLSGDFTIETWIRPRGNPFGDVDNYILMKMSGDYMSYDYFLTKEPMNLEGDGTIYFTTLEHAYEIVPPLRSQTTIIADGNNWYHVAVVKKGLVLKLFINGRLDIQSTFPSQLTVDNSYPLFLGTAYMDGIIDRPYAGDIEEMRISSSARYENNFLPQTTPFISDANTILLWHFNDGASLVVDSSGKGNTAQLAGNYQYHPSFFTIPTSRPTPILTLTSTPRPTATVTSRPTVTPTSRLSPTPTRRPTATLTPMPTLTPTPKPAKIQGRIYYDINGALDYRVDSEQFGPVSFRMDYYDPWQIKIIISGGNKACVDICSPTCGINFQNGGYSTPEVKAGNGYQLRLVLNDPNWIITEAYLARPTACNKNKISGVTASGLGTYLVNVYNLNLIPGEIKNIWFGVKPR